MKKIKKKTGRKAGMTKKFKLFSFPLTEDMRQRIETAAFDARVPMAALIRRAIEKEIKISEGEIKNEKY